jgi:transcriptional regulator with XRE-family HTH domain
MHEVGTIGARLRILRKWRGMTLAQVAGQAGLSTSFLSMVERGERALDRRSHIAAIAAALRVSEVDVVGRPHLPDDPALSDPHGAIPALRIALQTNSITRPAVETARPLPELVAEMTGTVEPLIRLCEYGECGRYLPGLIEELSLHAHSPVDEAGQGLALESLVTVYGHAAEFAKCYAGQRDLSYLAAAQAVQAADMLGSPVQQGKAAMRELLSMPHDGIPGLAVWERTHSIAKRAADRLEPHARDQLGLQVLGMLALMTSMSAAAMNRYDVATQWLDEAAGIARRVSDDIDHNWMGFSPTNVGVWQISIGLERGETGGRMLEMARRVKVDKLDKYRSRQATLFADVGRGLAREKRTREQAVRWLSRAEQVAPQFIRSNSAMRDSVQVLLTHSISAPAVGRELRGMAARMGIPH